MNSPDNNSNQNSDKSSVKHDELRQQLWEMAYGLLEPEAEAELRAQIKSDPAIARLYSEVRLQSDLVGVAARVNDSSLHIASGPDAKVTKVDARSRSKHPSRTMPAADAKSWNTNWLAVGGTVALLVLLAFGLNQPQVTVNSVAQAEYFFTSLKVPANTPAGVSQTVEVKTTSVDERGRPAAVALRVVDGEGMETFRKQLRTNDQGLGSVELPGSVMRPGARLEAIPDDEVSRERAGGVVSAELKVAEEPQQTVVLLQSPRAKAGDKVGFWAADVKQFSKQVTLPETDELMIEGRSGEAVAEPKWRKDQGTGIISGEFQVPQDPSLDVTSLGLRRRSNAVAQKQDQADKTPGGFERKGESYSDRQELALNPSSSVSQANGAIGAAELQRRGGVLKPRSFSKSGSAAPKEGEPQPEAPQGVEGGGGKIGPAPRIARSMAAPADALPQNTPAPPPAPAPAAPAAQVPGPPTGTPAAPPVYSPAPRPAAKAMPAPLPAGADASGGAAANRKNAAANQLTDNVADGNQVANPKAADRPGALRDPAPAVAPELKPGTASTKDARAMERASAPSEKENVIENPFSERDAQAFAFGARPMDQPSAETAQVDGKELRQLQFPQELMGKRAVLVARQHGVPVVRREIASLQEADHFVELPPEINGRVDVELYRPDDATRPVYRQQIVRAAARSLHFEVKGLQDSYAPGEKVQLQVGVRDEQGNPVMAAVGVRVWNEVAVRETKTPLLLVDALNKEANPANDAVALAAALPQAVMAKREAAKEQTLGAVAGNAAMARGIPAPGAAVPGVAGPAAAAASRTERPAETETPALQATTPPAEVAIAPKTPSQLKRVVEQEELRQSAGKKILGAEQFATEQAISEDVKKLEGSADVFFVNQQIVADNRAVVKQEYEAAIAAAQSQRIERVQWFGRLLLWAGAGLMLLIAALLVARRPLKSAVWIPAVGIAALSLALGLAWFVPAQPAGRELARLDSTTGATNQEVQPEMAAPAPMAGISPPVTLDDQEGVQSGSLVNNAQIVDAPQPPAAAALPPAAATDPTVPALPSPAGDVAAGGPAVGGRGQGYGGGAGLAPGGLQPARPNIAMRAKVDPPGNQADDRDAAKGQQVEEKQAQDKLAEAKKASSPNEPGRAPAAKPGEATDKVQPEVSRALDERAAGIENRGELAAPDSIYWRPLSIVDNDGTFTIEFTMPEVESDYRLLLDAIGNGRVGGQQQLLICREKE